MEILKCIEVLVDVRSLGTLHVEESGSDDVHVHLRLALVLVDESGPDIGGGW